LKQALSQGKNKDIMKNHFGNDSISGVGENETKNIKNAM